MLIRREAPADETASRAVIAEAFADPAAPGAEPLEAPLLDELRADPGWLPRLSLVAVEDGEVVGHVCSTRGRVGDVPAVGLGPIGVRRDAQGRGIGSALVHASVAAAEALDEPLLALLGSTEFYGRLGFAAAEPQGVVAPDPSWGAHFQVRRLAAWTPAAAGTFQYAEPFNRL